MKSLTNSLFLSACHKEKTNRPPIWLMRQAGRYMKEYRDIRAQHDFLSLCKNSDLCADITVHAATTLGVDAAIIFSDLLLLLEPLGFHLSYGKDQGPLIANPFREAADLKRVTIQNAADKLNFVYSAIEKTQNKLKGEIPLIGFAGAPFTMAAYMIEGRGSKTFDLTQKLMFQSPQVWHEFLDLIVEATASYVQCQIKAGANAIQIFDSWVGHLSIEDYRTYVLPHSRKLFQKISHKVPTIHFGTKTGHLLPLIKEAGGDVIGADASIDIDLAWKMIGADRAIMGNLDPRILLESPERIEMETLKILNKTKGKPGYIFNLGHGILPTTPVEHVHHLIKVVKNFTV